MTNDPSKLILKLFTANFGKSYEKLEDIHPIIVEIKPDIILLQEVICVTEQLNRATKMLENKGYVGIGSSLSRFAAKGKKNEKLLARGTPAYLIEKNNNVRNCTTTLTFIKDTVRENIEIIETEIDTQGRYSYMRVKINEKESLTIWNVYGPPEGGKISDDFFRRLKKRSDNLDNKLASKDCRNLNVFAGDMNAKMDTKKDKKFPNKTDESNTKYQGFKEFIREKNLIDTFLQNSKEKIDYTFRQRVKGQAEDQETRIDWILATNNDEDMSFSNETIVPRHKDKNILKDHKAIVSEMTIHNYANDNRNKIEETPKRTTYDVEEDEVKNIMNSDEFLAKAKTDIDMIEADYLASCEHLIDCRGVEQCRCKERRAKKVNYILDDISKLIKETIENEIDKREKSFLEEMRKEEKEKAQKKNCPKKTQEKDKQKTKVKHNPPETKITARENRRKRALAKREGIPGRKEEHKPKAWKIEKIKREINTLRRWIDLVKKNKNIIFAKERNPPLAKILKNIDEKSNIDLLTNLLREKASEKKLRTRETRAKYITDRIQQMRNRNGNDIRKLNREFQRNGFETGEKKVKEIVDSRGITKNKSEEITEVFAEGMSEILKEQYKDDNNFLTDGKYDNIKEKIEKNGNDEMKERIEEDEFELMLKKISTKTAPGISKINGAMIVHAKILHRTIFNCFNVLYDTGYTPTHWKESITKILHKKGNTADINNYRPIALLECFYKAYSTIIMIKMQKHVYQDNKIIHPLQFGFRPEFSIAQPIWTLRSVLEDAKEKKKKLFVLYIDFKKAYDRVEWKEMIKILEFYETPKKTVQAIKSFLDKRQTIFHTPTGISDKKEITRGLPQGDPLSTILFNIFINILLKKVSSTIRGYKVTEDIHVPLIAFADDLNIITDSVQEMELAVQVIQTFCDQTSFEVNIQKSCITSNEIPPSLKWTTKEGETIEVPKADKNTAIRFLGIWISLELDWSTHNNKVVTATLMSLNKLRNKSFDLYQRITIINLLITPLIRFYMQFVKLKEETITTINKAIKSVLNVTAGNTLNTKIERYQTPKELGGQGLTPLDDLQTTAYTTTLLNLGINFEHEYPQKLLIQKVREHSQIQTQNPVNDRTISKTEKKTDEHGIIETLQVMLTKMQLEMSGWNHPIENRKFLFEVIKNNNNPTTKWNIIKKETQKDEKGEEQLKKIRFALVGTDGSLKKKSKTLIIGGAVALGPERFLQNESWATRITNTNLGAEMESILVAINIVKKETNLCIATDSMNSIKLIQKKEWKYKEKYNCEEYPIIANINHLIEEKKQKARLIIEYVPAHQDTKNKEGNNKKINSYNSEIDHNYIDGANKMRTANIVADRLADEGGNKKIIPLTEPLKGMPLAVLKQKESRDRLIAGNFKGIIKENLKDSRKSKIEKILGESKVKIDLKTSFSKITEQKVKERILKITSGNMKFGNHIINNAKPMTNNNYDSCMKIAHPSPFCEEKSCKGLNKVYNLSHLMFECGHPELLEKREKIIKSAKEAILADKTIKQEDERVRLSNSIVPWWIAENYEVYTKSTNKTLIKDQGSAPVIAIAIDNTNTNREPPHKTKANTLNFDRVISLMMQRGVAPEAIQEKVDSINKERSKRSEDAKTSAQARQREKEERDQEKERKRLEKNKIREEKEKEKELKRKEKERIREEKKNKKNTTTRSRKNARTIDRSTNKPTKAQTKTQEKNQNEKKKKNNNKNKRKRQHQLPLNDEEYIPDEEEPKEKKKKPKRDTNLDKELTMDYTISIEEREIDNTTEAERFNQEYNLLCGITNTRCVMEDDLLDSLVPHSLNTSIEIVMIPVIPANENAGKVTVYDLWKERDLRIDLEKRAEANYKIEDGKQREIIFTNYRNRYLRPVTIRKWMLTSWLVAKEHYTRDITEREAHEEIEALTKIFQKLIEIDLGKGLVVRRLKPTNNYDINDNEHNRVERIRYSHGLEEENIRVNVYQNNLIIYERTTQKNINTRNKALLTLAEGKITKDETKKGVDIKLRSRGVITEELKTTIANMTGLSTKQVKKVNKIATILNTEFIKGIDMALETQRINNIERRRKEGVDIRRRYPRAVRKKTASTNGTDKGGGNGGRGGTQGAPREMEEPRPDHNRRETRLSRDQLLPTTSTSSTTSTFFSTYKTLSTPTTQAQKQPQRNHTETRVNNTNNNNND